MMKDAWDDYVRYAWGDNELRPVTQTGYTGGIFGTAKIGSTIVDSLDTLYIMELDAEYRHAREFVATNLTFQNIVRNSVRKNVLTKRNAVIVIIHNRRTPMSQFSK